MNRTVEVCATAMAAAQAAAARFVERVSAAIATRGRCVVALAGGSTPREMYVLLTQPPLVGAVDWSRVEVVWGDERCVPPNDPESNYRMARLALLDHVAIPASRIHRIHGEAPPVTAAADYEQALRLLLRTPAGPPQDVAGHRIDLVLLGLGDDGHTASLFPGTPAIEDEVSWATAVVRPGAEAMWRVTLTPPVLNAAGEVLFLVTGSGKAPIVRQLLATPPDTSHYPAQLIRPSSGSVHWILDAAAGGQAAGGG